MAKRSAFAALPLALFFGAALVLFLDREQATEWVEAAKALAPVPAKPALFVPIVGATSEAQVDLPGPEPSFAPGLEGAELARLLAERRSNERCEVCGDGIAPGSTFLKAEDGSRWHQDCHSRRATCGLSGRPVPDGAAYVEVLGEAFLRGPYEAAQRCLATGLPVDNHGEFVLNGRTATKVLSSALKRTRRCVSCQDHLLEGWDVGGVGFSCAECVASFRATVEGKLDVLRAEASAFLEGEGLTVPPVEVFSASGADGLSESERGLCQTNVTTRFGSRSFEHRILILSHLTEEVTLAVLCHELTHAVIARSGVQFETGDEEGICELAAWRFGKARGFAPFVLAGIEDNQVDAYREGFRRQRAKNLPLMTLIEAGP